MKIEKLESYSSNVIAALREKRKKRTKTFWLCIKIGVALTIIGLAIIVIHAIIAICISADMYPLSVFGFMLFTASGFMTMFSFVFYAVIQSTGINAAQRIMTAFRIDDSAFERFDQELAGGRGECFSNNRIILTDSWLCFPFNVILFPLREIKQAQQKISIFYDEGQSIHNYHVIFTFSNGEKFTGVFANQGDMYLFTAVLMHRCPWAEFE